MELFLQYNKILLVYYIFKVKILFSDDNSREGFKAGGDGGNGVGGCGGDEVQIEAKCILLRCIYQIMPSFVMSNEKEDNLRSSSCVVIHDN